MPIGLKKILIFIIILTVIYLSLLPYSSEYAQATALPDTNQVTQIQQNIQKLSAKIDILRTEAKAWQYPMTCIQIAEALLELANIRSAANTYKGAQRALNCAQNTLENVSSHISEEMLNPYYLLDFRLFKITSESFITGQSYDFIINWKCINKLEKKTVSLQYVILDEHGQIIFETIHSPKKPLYQWSNSSFRDTVIVTIPADLKQYLDTEPSSEKKYYIAVNAKSQDGKKVLINKAEALHFFPSGGYYIIKEVFIASVPIQIKQLVVSDIDVHQTEKVNISIENKDTTHFAATCFVRIYAETGNTIHEAFTDITMRPNEKRTLNLPWKSNFVGNLMCKVFLYHNDVLYTWAEQKFKVGFPSGMRVGIARDQHVLHDSMQYLTPLLVSMKGLAKAHLDYYKITIWNESKRIYEKSKFLSYLDHDIEEFITLEPTWDYYLIRLAFSEGRKEFFYEKKIPGGVVEIDSNDILINGEPFYIQGLAFNNHLLEDDIYLDTLLQKLFKCGFNMIPAGLLNSHLLESNSSTRFSFSNVIDIESLKTDYANNIFSANDFLGYQAILTQYILAHRDQPTLFWEFKNDNNQMVMEALFTTLAIIKIYDTYHRPLIIHNSDNLPDSFWQSNLFGDLIISTTTNFNVLTLKHSHPNLVCIPLSNHHQMDSQDKVNKTETEQLIDGVIYDATLTGNDKQNHSVIVQLLCMLHKFKTSKADVEIKVVGRYHEKVTIEIMNRQKYTLRKVQLDFNTRNIKLKSIQMRSIPANSTQKVTLWLPRELGMATVEILGTISFETHFGLARKKDMRIFVK